MEPVRHVMTYVKIVLELSSISAPVVREMGYFSQIPLISVLKLVQLALQRVTMHAQEKPKIFTLLLPL
jgi:hypothetical protein